MKKYLMYRYNSFLKDEGNTSLIRVRNKEYRIKKEIFTYEELLKCMSYFKELREVETLEEYTLQSKIVRFLMQIGVLNYSEVTYPDAKILRYLIKNYIDFDQMMISLANSDIEIKVIGHESEQLTKLLENRIQMYFGDFSSNKVTRKTQIIVVDQRNDLDKIEEAIANIEADNYIVMAFNANKESWIYSTKIKSEVIQMLDQFMCCSEKKVRFSDAFCAVAANYMVLMLMDSLSGYRKMFNTYCINSSLEIKNKSFYGLKLGADVFRKVKEDYVRIDESVTEAEALNRFIVKSKDIIDMNFEYEFMNDGNINRVITRVKDKEVIEAEGKNELLLDAAKESVAETIIKLFQSYGVRVSLALGFDEIKRLFASEKSVYAFDDKGIFSKEGVLIFRVD